MELKAELALESVSTNPTRADYLKAIPNAIWLLFSNNAITRLSEYQWELTSIVIESHV